MVVVNHIWCWLWYYNSYIHFSNRLPLSSFISVYSSTLYWSSPLYNFFEVILYGLCIITNTIKSNQIKSIICFVPLLAATCVLIPPNIENTITHKPYSNRTNLVSHILPNIFCMIFSLELSLFVCFVDYCTIITITITITITTIVVSYDIWVPS